MIPNLLTETPPRVRRERIECWEIVVQCYHLEFSYLLDVINLAFRGRGFRRCAMQNSKKKGKIDIRLSFSERGTKPSKNQYNFHRGLKYFSKVSCHRPTAQQMLCGKVSPRGPTPYLFIYQFCQKKVPLFVYYLLTNSTPFICLIWILPLLKMHCLYNEKLYCVTRVEWHSRNFARVRSLFILGSCVSVSKAVYVVILF